MITKNIQETKKAVADMALFKNRSDNTYSKLIVRDGHMTHSIYPREFAHGNSNYDGLVDDTIRGNPSYFSQFPDPYSVGIYVVFSYGNHYPMFIYDRETKQWFVNEDNYSATTSKHRSMLMPCKDPNWLPNKHMADMVSLGSYNLLTQHRLGSKTA